MENVDGYFEFFEKKWKKEEKAEEQRHKGTKNKEKEKKAEYRTQNTGDFDIDYFLLIIGYFYGIFDQKRW